MFWFDKTNPDVLFVDNRTMERQVIWEGRGESAGRRRMFEVKPDAVMDFRKLELPDRSFHLVVFDPPHFGKRNGKGGWLAKKYGSLDQETWREDLRAGFRECFRVLKKNGVLVFKWSEAEIPTSEVLELAEKRPLFGHKSGKSLGTHWLCFIK